MEILRVNRYFSIFVQEVGSTQPVIAFSEAYGLVNYGNNQLPKELLKEIRPTVG